MAIRLKGLEYFPLDVDFFENEKIAIIISDFGFEASAVVLKLLGRIYKNGFYLKWDEKACKIFTNSFRSRYSSAEIQRIVDALTAGKLVVAIMAEGHFTRSGHFIVLRGVQDGKILVADPASYDRSGMEWDLNIILNEASTRAAAGGPFWIIG